MMTLITTEITQCCHLSDMTVLQKVATVITTEETESYHPLTLILTVESLTYSGNSGYFGRNTVLSSRSDFN